VTALAIDRSVAGWFEGKLSDLGAAFRTFPVPLKHFSGELSSVVFLGIHETVYLASFLRVISLILTLKILSVITPEKRCEFIFA